MQKKASEAVIFFLMYSWSLLFFLTFYLLICIWLCQSLLLHVDFGCDERGLLLLQGKALGARLSSYDA